MSLTPWNSGHCTLKVKLFTNEVSLKEVYFSPCLRSDKTVIKKPSIVTGN